MNDGRNLGIQIEQIAKSRAGAHASWSALRSRRRRPVRARSVHRRELSQHKLEIGRALYPETDYWRPTTRADCERVERPCPYVLCRYNLYLDVIPRTGSIKLNFPDLEPSEMEVSCVLDVAELGGLTLMEAGDCMNITRERARQLEEIAYEKLLPLLTMLDPSEQLEGSSRPACAKLSVDDREAYRSFCELDQCSCIGDLIQERGP